MTSLAALAVRIGDICLLSMHIRIAETRVLCVECDLRSYWHSRRKTWHLCRQLSLCLAFCDAYDKNHQVQETTNTHDTELNLHGICACVYLILVCLSASLDLFDSACIGICLFTATEFHFDVPGKSVIVFLLSPCRRVFPNPSSSSRIVSDD